MCLVVKQRSNQIQSICNLRFQGFRLYILQFFIINYINQRIQMLEKTSLLFSLYFITNYLLLLCYPILRFITGVGDQSLKNQDNFGFTYENSIIYTVLVLAVIAYTRSTSNQQFLIDSIIVGKIGVACLLFIAKLQYCIWYVVVCVILWVIVPYPKLKSKNKFIKITSKEQFQQFLSAKKDMKNTKNQSNFLHFQYRDKIMYFVEFYADWNLVSTFSKQLWYEYSNKYTTQQVKFLSVNIGKVPSIAQKYQINISGFSKQLPTVMIIEDGEEKIRFPPVDKNNKVPKVAKYDYRILLRYFDLQSRYLETRN